jgi:DNA-directed RNA polymerase alpha subunit
MAKNGTMNHQKIIWEEKNIMQNKLDQLANLWNKTKNIKYKKSWYKLVKKIYGKKK